MISTATWIVWLHLLAMAAWLGGGLVVLGVILPSLHGEAGRVAARRAHFLTSRAMEIVVVTGILNLLLRAMASGMTFSRGFVGMLSLKIVLLIAMAAAQVWMGIAWRRADAAAAAVRKARVALTVQLVLGAVAVLLGLGLRGM